MGIVSGAGYISGQGNAVVTIAEPAVPTVSIAASQPNAAEADTGPAVDGQFTVTRTGNLSQGLTVNLAISGNATDGTDYSDVAPTVTFAAGTATATIGIDPLPDGLLGG